MTDFQADIVILGAGIGGYETFRTLAKQLKRHRLKKTILLVDKHNYFTFTPMLHEVATGSVEPHHCAIPLRELMYGTPHQFLKAVVEKVDPEENTIKTNQGTVSYDYCVVALGSKTNFFGVPGAETHAHHVRDLASAIHLQETIIEELEDPKKDHIHVTVVGGGFTGIEVAGQLCDLFSQDVPKLYKGKELKLTVIESGESVLKRMPAVVREKVTTRLTSHGVHIETNSRVKKVEARTVTLDSGVKLHSDITIWAGGFKNIAPDFLPEALTEKGRIPVTDCLAHAEYKNLYAVGDIVLFQDAKSGLVAPQLGEAAHREGQYVGRHIVKMMRGKKKTKPFCFKPHGTLIPVGDWYGAAIIGRIIFFGRFAWWIRRTTYLLFLPGFLRKLKIVIDWTLHGIGFRYIIDMHDPYN